MSNVPSATDATTSSGDTELFATDMLYVKPNRSERACAVTAEAKGTGRDGKNTTSAAVLNVFTCGMERKGEVRGHRYGSTCEYPVRLHRYKQIECIAVDVAAL